MISKSPCINLSKVLQFCITEFCIKLNAVFVLLLQQCSFFTRHCDVLSKKEFRMVDVLCVSSINACSFLGWIKGILPKSALTVEEEAWNAYPYTKTRYTCPFVEKFSLEIETYYFADNGHQENVFKLTGSDLRNRIIGKKIYKVPS